MSDKNLKSPIKIGVVGCGGIAQIMHLPFLVQHPDVEVTAICDVDYRKASILAGRYQVKNIYADIEEMLARHMLDAVFLLTPTNLHLPMTLLALRKGINVFVEKPLARTAAEAERLIQAVQNSGRRVMVGMQSRFRRDVLAMKNILSSEELGQPFFIKAEWLLADTGSMKQNWLSKKRISGGGVLLDLGIQLIDASWWLYGKPEVVSVKAVHRQLNPKIKVEDFFSFLIEFSEGMSLSAQVSWDLPIDRSRFQAEVYSDSGYIRMNPFKVQRVEKGRIRLLPYQIGISGREILREAYRNEIDHFVDVLLGKTGQLGSPVDDAVKILHITDALYKSMQTGCEVRFDRREEK